MSKINKVAKTLSLDRDVVLLIEDTRDNASMSERVNQLLKAGLEFEKRRGLELEAAEFFNAEEDHADHRAFQAASLKVLSRE